MGIVSYKDLSRTDSKALFADALAISIYSCHRLDDGLAYGSYHMDFTKKYC